MIISLNKCRFWIIKLLVLINIMSLFQIKALPLGLILIIGYAIISGKRILCISLKHRYPSSSIVWSLLVIILINEIYCMFKYGQSIFTGILGIYYIFLIFSYFIFFDYFIKNENAVIDILKWIFMVTSIVAILSLIQFALFPHFNVFSNYAFRNGGLRIYGTALSYYAQVFLISFLVAGDTYKGEKIRKVQLAILLMTLVIVSKSRGGVITLVLATIYIIYKKLITQKNGFLKILIFTGIVGVLLKIVLKSNYGDFIFSFLNEIEQGSGSGSTRINEMEYYYNEFLKNKLFGIGVLRGGSSLADLIYRKDLWYYIEDLGITGFVFQTGILGLGWIVFVLISLVKKIKILLKTKNKMACIVSYSAVMILITSLVGITNTNYIVDRASIICFCILLAMMDALIVKLRRVNNEN